MWKYLLIYFWRDNIINILEKAAINGLLIVDALYFLAPWKLTARDPSCRDICSQSLPTYPHIMLIDISEKPFIFQPVTETFFPIEILLPATFSNTIRDLSPQHIWMKYAYSNNPCGLSGAQTVIALHVNMAFWDVSSIIIRERYVVNNLS